ncbi:Ff.00g094640.m01.CDS01 [Fusarium sp. VM40]|nr:Ff.00g094640.m01.CDS01 [Fusarium sp. VM40]
MFTTKSVQSLKNLFASYHEPLPLSKQQSQKLLDGLKTSFRKQLDREYGESSNSPSQAQPTTKSIETDPARLSAANRHLKDILANPLFSYNKDVTSTFPSSLSSAAPTVSARDPIEVFDHAVARGLMTPKAAIGVMHAKAKQLQAQQPGLGGLSTAGISGRVIRWLQACGAEQDLRFMDNYTFVRTLAPFMVAEGMEEIAWEWLVRTVNDASGKLPKEKRLKRASHLLGELVKAKCQPQYGNLDSGISTMLQAQQLFRTSPLLSDLLVSSWRSVSWFSTVEAYSRSAPSEELFDAHIATADRLPLPFQLERAHLHLYHPTHPDHLPALNFFKDKEKIRTLVSALGPKKAKPEKLSTVSWLAFLGHDTVNHLTQSGRTQEAQGVTEFLQAEVASLFNIKNRTEPALGF